MTKRYLTILATLAASVASGSIALAQSGYMPAPDASVARDPNYPPGGYRADDPRLANGAPDDADEAMPGRAPVYSDRIAPPAPVGPSDDPRYARPAYSDRDHGYPDRGYAERAPQGPVLSPDDPRYGRPAGPPAVIYSDRGYPERPTGLPQFNDRPVDDPYARAVRPPEAVTGSLSSAPRQEGQPIQLSALPVEERPEVGPAKLEPRFQRQEVAFATKEPAGTIVVDTPNTYLYYVLGNNRAVRYGIRVGRDGFRWNGVQKISRKAEWPDWHPPSEMIERQPYLPRFMAGGEGNPLGARAMYLGSTIYRIHGTNQPSTIGKTVSSGCFGMLNEDVSDLFERVKIGTRVVVLPGNPPASSVTASAQPAPAPYPPAPASAAPQSYSVPGTQPSSVQPLPPPTSIR